MMTEKGEIEIRQQGPADDAGVFIVNERAFGRPDEARLVEKLRQAADSIPELSLVAVAGGQIVGHVLFSHVTLETARGHVPVLALAPLAVLPEHQNQGIGSALSRHGLAEARRLGHKIVIVLGHADYYPRFGFSRASDYGIRCAYDVPEDVFMATALCAGALDGMQGVVRYPPVFDGV